MTARAALLVFCLTAIAGAADAQQPQEPDKTARHLLVWVEAAAGAASADIDGAVLTKSLALALRGSVPGLKVVERGPSAFPGALEARSNEAQALGADSWLVVSIAGGAGAWSLHAQSYDIVAGKMVLDQTVSRARELTVLDAARERWDDVVPLVLDAYHSAPTSNLPRPQRRAMDLVIHALPRTRIMGLPGGPLVTGASGAVTARVEGPSAFRLRATLSGYEPVNQDVYVDADRDLQITQRPSAIIAADAGFFNAFFFDAEAGIFLIPDTAFVKFGVTSFLLGLSLDRNSTSYSFPLMHVNVQGGWYFMPVDAGFRLYATLGGFCRVVFIPDFPIRVDALSPGGVQLGIGAEITIAGRSRFFFEYVPMLYLSGLPDLFQDSIGNAPGFIPLPFGAIDVMNARFGLRWLL